MTGPTCSLERRDAIEDAMLEIVNDLPPTPPPKRIYSLREIELLFGGSDRKSRKRREEAIRDSFDDALSRLSGLVERDRVGEGNSARDVLVDGFFYRRHRAVKPGDAIHFKARDFGCDGPILDYIRRLREAPTICWGTPPDPPKYWLRRDAGK